MSEPNAPVRLDYRHVPLAEAPTLHPAGDGVFVALATPPPVRTVLRVVDVDGSARALEVTRVVEVADTDARGERGFYARFVDDEALAASEKVGSEHLGSGEAAAHQAQPDPEPTGPEGESDVGNAAMAMPAPVVVDEDEDEDDTASEAAAEGETEGDDEAGASGSRRGRAKKRRAKKPRK